jgi:hypothetical protein
MVDLLTFGGKNPGEWGDYALETKGSQEKVKKLKGDVKSWRARRPSRKCPSGLSVASRPGAGIFTSLKIISTHVRDIATNHLPHVSSRLRQIAEEKGIELHEPPPRAFVDLHGRRRHDWAVFNFYAVLFVRHIFAAHALCTDK